MKKTSPPPIIQVNKNRLARLAFRLAFGQAGVRRAGVSRGPSDGGLPHRTGSFRAGVAVCLAVLAVGLVGCVSSGGDASPRRGRRKAARVDVAVKAPTLRVFIENSQSMDGYVDGGTEFKDAINSYLSEVVVKRACSDMEFYFVNQSLHRQPGGLTSFMQQLTPSAFRQAGGDRRSTDFAELFRTVLQATRGDTLGVFISDFIFSPGPKVDAQNYLVDQQLRIRKHFRDAIEREGLSVVVYQLYSHFKGRFYDRVNARFDIETSRPYYIWLLGRPAQVAQVVAQVGTSCVLGQGVSHSLFFAPKQEVSYMVQRNTRRGKYSWQNRKTVRGAEVDGARGGFVLPLRVDYGGMLYDAQYLCDASNYAVGGTRGNLFRVSEVLAKESKGGYTHQLLVSLDEKSRIVPATDLEVSLLLRVPDWVDALNDPTGLGAGPDELRTTYGLRALIDGVHGAYALDGEAMVEMEVDIAK